MTRTTVAIALLVACASTVEAQPAGAPQVLNGRVEARAGGDLAAVIRAVAQGPTDVTWVGYSVPAEGRAHRCCWKDSGDAGGCCWGCRLEQGGGTAMRLPASGATDSPVPLEPVADRAVVLVRVAAGAIDRIRVYAPSCTLDAGGRTVLWLSAVTADASVTWLNAQATSGARRLADDAVMALSAHAAPVALDRLIALARTGASTHLRGQALFWLAQRAGDRAVGAISEAIDNDPDTDVKRRAVFALSQLPEGDGVPRLIAVARTHSNAAVRKQAFFWLGQSKDPRALAFFAEILAR